MGLGISSCIFFIWLAAGGGKFPFYCFIVLEASLTTSIAAILWPFIKNVPLIRKEPGGIVEETPLEQILPTLLLVSVVLSAGSFAILAARHPHGTYDAWMIWNMHARFLFGGEHWQSLFSHTLSWVHADYPLLLSCAVARSWRYTGNTATLVPIAVAAVFTLATIGFVVSAVSMLKDKVQGLLAGMALLGTHYFVVCGASQYADIPLGFFMCACLAMFYFYERGGSGKYKYLVLAGIMGGMASWTKNEGAAFLAAVMLSRLLFVTLSKGIKTCAKELAVFICAALPILFVAAYFKLRFAPATDIFDLQGIGQISAKLANSGRYIAAANLFGSRFVRFGGLFSVGIVPALVVYIILAGIRIDRRDVTALATSALTITLTAGTYFFIFIITPWDIEWHIEHSLNRLYMQLWPSILFFIFMIARQRAMGLFNGLNFR
jgi:hypothetical protein